jgi:nucleoside-diphosphate-sugar epimerase
MSDRTALSEAISKSQAVISLLGPSTKSQPKDTFADYYRTIIPLMKQHGVHRILVLGTTAIYQPEDQSSITRALMCNLIKLIANSGYQNIMAVQDYFESIKNDTSIQWTVFRLGMLSGTGGQAEWSSGRDSGKIFNGPVGAPGFTGGINRSLLARWLVDTATANPETHVRSMPAVSKSG